MNCLQEELITIRMCGALREVPLEELSNPMILMRIFLSAVKREKIKRQINQPIAKETFK